ncbi:MAG: DEAD/DEAH box helicase [Actinomycetota bacterium]
MTLSTRLAPRVPAALQERGRKLHLKGAVFLRTGSDTDVKARVVGGHLYDVSVRLGERPEQPDVFCDCLYFAGGAGFCKHLWATVLSAEEQGYLAAAADGAGGLAPLAGLGLSDHMLERLAGDGTPPPSPDPWRSVLESVTAPRAATAGRWPAGRTIGYEINLARSRLIGALMMDVVYRDERQDGAPRVPKPLTITAQVIANVPEPADRQILAMLLGATDTYRYPYSGYGRVPGTGVKVPEGVAPEVLRGAARTGRGLLYTEAGGGVTYRLELDDGSPWEVVLTAGRKAAEESGTYVVDAELRRDEQRRAVDGLLVAGDVFVEPTGAMGCLADPADAGWVRAIGRSGAVAVPQEAVDEFLRSLIRAPRVPRLDFPPELTLQRVQVRPRFRLQVEPGERYQGARNPKLRARLGFDYRGQVVQESDPAEGVLEPGTRTVLERDRPAEQQAAVRLEELKLRPAAAGQEYLLAPGRLPAVARELTGEGWRVEAEGRLYRPAGPSRMTLSSGIDWFELQGSMDFGEQTAALPELLAAARRGEAFVRLGDGSVGLLPEEWLAEYKAIAGLGTPGEDGLRFERAQVGLVDALLAARPEVSFDGTFRQARQRLLEFDAVQPGTEPEGFGGSLRPYQKEGLGWFKFLQDFGFGGCLADDMGLGKTVQVLALLQSRAHGDATKPSLVVVPSSLVFNWLEEAARFTPQLRVLDHTGRREEPGSHFEDYHLVLTTYGTLRKDIARLAEIEFDYCILDEAQAIKNPSTATAKAARLLVADHRLALSGTPIENHLGELWSLFDFLNPGMLGSVSAFRKGIGAKDLDEQGRRALAAAVRPFVLRRTKQQVAADLPAKTEQTQFCELPAAQRRQYDQLRKHYRRSLLQRVDSQGMARSKIQVLEALLRLRQAACHPGLIDAKRSREASAKLDLLVPQLIEVCAEGHKALVFSQFTTMLGILKDRLEPEGLTYEYLDGHTRDRQAPVRRFQADPDCRLFLISLKAGGLGLNLTAAEYVFLLDPWWNPAVEAQAIDRAHRIGQDKPVFAYRIIARDTVEEKVLALQESKRELADAIIGGDNSLIRRIRREDLELLLS